MAICAVAQSLAHPLTVEPSSSAPIRWCRLTSVQLRTENDLDVRRPVSCSCSKESESWLSSASSWSRSSPWQRCLDSVVIDVIGAEASPLNVPLLAPFTIATTKLESVQNVSIRLTLRDGSVGWGEAPTLPPVTVEDHVMALSRATQACTVLKSLSSGTVRDIFKQISDILPDHDVSSVRGGLEMAVADAVAHSLKLPLWKLFGGHCAQITTDITIPICGPEEAEKLAGEYARRGFDIVKTKVGGRALSTDIAMLKGIRRGHPSCSLILDANCGYNADESLQVLKDLHDIGLTPVMLEQPVLRDDWVGLGHVNRVAREVYGVAVGADESCRNLCDAKRIVDGGLAEVVNIKLSKMGLLEALDIIQLVRDAGLQLMIGGMIETKLGVGFSAQLAAGLGCFRFADLDGPLLMAGDPVQGGYEVDGSLYIFTDSYGHGGSL